MGSRSHKKLEKIKTKENGINYPRCIKGKRACPPEDCGGIPGYMELEKIMKNKQHESYEEMREWIGYDLEPELFEMEKINYYLGEKNYGVITNGF